MSKKDDLVFERMVKEKMARLEEQIGSEEMDRELTDGDRYAMLLSSANSSHRELVARMEANGDAVTVAGKVIEGAVTGIGSVLTTAEVYNEAKTYREAVEGMLKFNAGLAQQNQEG